MRTILLGGFLGSGKTTLLNLLIEHFSGNGRPGSFAVLINEFGDIPVDTLLIEKGGLLIREVTGGCICCSLKGRLREAVEQLAVEVRPDYLFIEATGIAVPSEIAATLSDMNILTLLCLDAQQYRRFSSSLVVFRRQLEEARLVYLSRSDILDPELVESVAREIGEMNGKCRVVSDAAGLMELLEEELAPAGGEVRIPAGKEAGAHEHEGGDIVQETSGFDRRMTMEEIRELCGSTASRHGADLLRLKGVVETDGGWFAFQYHEGTLAVSESEPAPGRAGMVVITLPKGR